MSIFKQNKQEEAADPQKNLTSFFRAQIQDQNRTMTRKINEMSKLVTDTLQPALREIASLKEELSGRDALIDEIAGSLGDLKKELSENSRKVETFFAREAEKEIEIAKERERSLLKLVLAYHDALFDLTKGKEEAGSDEPGPSLEESRILNGIQVIASTGIPFSYELHEALELRPTGDKEQDMKIAEVFSCGYVYHGELLRKCRVAAYQYKETAADLPKEQAKKKEGLIDPEDLLLDEESTGGWFESLDDPFEDEETSLNRLDEIEGFDCLREEVEPFPAREMEEKKPDQERGADMEEAKEESAIAVRSPRPLKGRRSGKKKTVRESSQARYLRLLYQPAWKRNKIRSR